MKSKKSEKELVNTISSLKKRVAELESQQKSRSKGLFGNGIELSFLSQMSHELRTPINILLNAVDMLREDYIKDPDAYATEVLNIINGSSKRIHRTIDLLVHLIELQSGAYKYSLTYFDLYHDLKNILYKEYKTLADEKDIAFFWYQEGIEHSIETDAYAVTQIFQQLIDNAIKFTNFGKVEVIVKNEKNRHSLMVKDTGIGISEEFQSKLFDPFLQEDRGYSRKYEGTGLGLSVVKMFCSIINAKIKVESEKGIGSIFEITFAK